MKLLVISFSTDDTNHGMQQLKASMDHFGYEYHFLIGPQYSWGGDNYVYIAEWLKENRMDYTHILYTDAWDTLAMQVVDELVDKYSELRDFWLYSAEKNPCFTIDKSKYVSPSPWRYLCAGGYIAPIDLFIEVVEKEKRPLGENDQVWGSRNYESGKYKIALDTGCKIFQTMYDMGPFHVTPNWNEFEMKDWRFLNKITGTKPIFIHGNGKVDMRSIYHNADRVKLISQPMDVRG